ncbi:MAG TPA: amidohydrolase family protein, partial [Mycobacteriales bacterium]|nr:amidohydrolase family protein [Mycobacteriales bacterium]
SDLWLEGGLVREVRPADPEAVATGPDHLHLPGWQLLPAAVEPHAHLDKAFSWSTPVYGGLNDAIGCWREYAARMTGADVYARARRALAAYLAAGITAVRTHVDCSLVALPEIIRLRDELREAMDIQVVLLCSSTNPDLPEALRLGVDLIGGCPHLAADQELETRRLLDLAERHGLGVDLHTDEQCAADVLSIRHLVREVRTRRLAGVAASHCVSLGSLAPSVLADVLGEIRDAGVDIVTLPITNLYLQGRVTPTRGVPPLRAVLDAGIRLAAGGDNLRDPFNPMGRADPFETTSLLITAGHLNADQALHAITGGARCVLGLPAAGPEPGRRADLLAVRAESRTDVLAGTPSDRIVLRGGRVVSRTTIRSENAVSDR